MQGDLGALRYEPGMETPAKISAIQMDSNEIIETTRCGDAFVAATIFAIVEWGKSFEDAGKFGCLVGDGNVRSEDSKDLPMSKKRKRGGVEKTRRLGRSSDDTGMPHIKLSRSTHAVVGEADHCGLKGVAATSYLMKNRELIMASLSS